MEYGRGPEKVWVYGGALRIRDGHEVTLTARSRDAAGYLRLLRAVGEANPHGDLYLITDNLRSPKSPPVVEWLEAHPHLHQVSLPKGACWLNLPEGGWRGVPRLSYWGCCWLRRELGVPAARPLPKDGSSSAGQRLNGFERDVVGPLKTGPPKTLPQQ